MEEKYFRVMGTILFISVTFFIIAKLNFSDNYSVTISYYAQPSKTSDVISSSTVTEKPSSNQEEPGVEIPVFDKSTTAETEIAREEIAISFPLEINHITYDELLLIPGIGHVTATRIVQYRDYLGGYSSLEQLMEIKGIGESTFQDISGYLYLEQHIFGDNN